MRKFPMVAMFWMAACSGGTSHEVESSPTEAVPAASAATPTAPATTEPAAGQATTRTAPGAMPNGVAMPDYPKVAIVGFGLRFELNPPFQATRMKGMYRSENDQVLVVSWWDTAHETAGKHGRAGLYNVGIVPADKPDGEPVLRSFTEAGKNGDEHRRQVGETGTVVRFPETYSSLGGMGTVSVGPATKEWKVQVGDAEPVPFPEGEFLHSWDPKDGGPIHFDRRPQQPYGPWPTPPVRTAPKPPTPPTPPPAP
jgi:hypothetical protein